MLDSNKILSPEFIEFSKKIEELFLIKKQKQDAAQEYMKNLKKDLEELDSKAKELTVQFNNSKN